MSPERPAGRKADQLHVHSFPLRPQRCSVWLPAQPRAGITGLARQTRNQLLAAQDVPARSLPQGKAVSADRHGRKAKYYTFYKAASSFQFRPHGLFQPWPKDLLEVRKGSLTTAHGSAQHPRHGKQARAAHPTRAGRVRAAHTTHSCFGLVFNRGHLGDAQVSSLSSKRADGDRDPGASCVLDVC